MICHEQQKQLKLQTIERQVFAQELQVYRRVAEESVLECKDAYYDIFAKLAKSRSYQEIHDNMATTKENLEVADGDRNRLVRQLDEQVLASRESREALE